MTYYQQRIVQLLGVTPRDAVFVEAWLRTDRSTLDGLDAKRFKREADECLACVRACDDARNVRLAESHGFTVPPPSPIDLALIAEYNLREIAATRRPTAEESGAALVAYAAAAEYQKTQPKPDGFGLASEACRNAKKTRAPKGTPTAVNLFALAQLFGDKTEVPNQIRSTSVPHIRRCMKAGLVTLAGPKTLVLTEKGIAALKARAS